MVMTIGLEAQLRRHLRTREAHIFPHVFPHDDRSDVSNRTLRVRLIPPKKGLISTVVNIRSEENENQSSEHTSRQISLSCDRLTTIF